MPQDSSVESLSLMFCKSIKANTSCSYGDACRFVHDEKEKSLRLEKMKQKKRLQSKMGRGVCHVFLQGKECPYGDSCRFAHAEGEEAAAIEKRIEAKKAKRKDKEVKRKLEKAKLTMPLDNDDFDDGDDALQAEDDWDKDESSFIRWMGRTLRQCPLYHLYEDIFEEGLDVIMRWRLRYSNRPDIWSRFVKSRSGDSIRIVKEFCESVPVIDRVRKNLCKLTAEEESARKAGLELSKRIVTVLDLCSGFGFLSMFLSEMLPPDRVNRIIMIDINWSRTKLEKDSKLFRGQEDSIEKEDNADDFSSCQDDKLPGGHAESEKDQKGSKPANYISSEHFTGDFYEKWPIPLVASKQNLKKRSTLRSMQSVIINRACEEGELILLGIHLCGILSLRAVDIFNSNRVSTRLFALKPCCLPGIAHAKNNEQFVIGSHQFHAKDVSAPGKFVSVSKNKSGWSGPPRNHLESKFLIWTNNLSLGIDIPHSDDKEAADKKMDEEYKELTPTDRDISESDISKGWVKEVQHIPLQESGYQNKYIWVEKYAT